MKNISERTTFQATRDLYQPSNYQACELVISALMKYSKLNLKVSFGHFSQSNNDLGPFWNMEKGIDAGVAERRETVEFVSDPVGK